MDQYEEIREQRAQLLRLDKMAEELYHSVAVHFGFSDTVFWVLYSLCESDQVYTQNDLAALCCCPKQTVNSAVNNLIKSGYVRLEQMPGAHSGKAVRLTKEGEEACSRSIRPLLLAEQRAFLGLTGEERRLFLELSRKQYELFRKEVEKLT